MWSIADSPAPQVADVVYATLSANGTPEVEQSARRSSRLCVTSASKTHQPPLLGPLHLHRCLVKPTPFRSSRHCLRLVWSAQGTSQETLSSGFVRLRWRRSCAWFPGLRAPNRGVPASARVGSAGEPREPGHTRATSPGRQGSREASRGRQYCCRTRKYGRIRTLPKLTVRVRFPSPAPHAKNVAAQGNSTEFASRSNHLHVRNGARATAHALGHFGECPWQAVSI